jgi:hypothetical protein
MAKTPKLAVVKSALSVGHEVATEIGRQNPKLLIVSASPTGFEPVLSP